MPLFVSPHSLRAVAKYYEQQERTSLDHLCHLANRWQRFIVLQYQQLQLVMFALYFGMIAQRHGSHDAASTSKSASYGSINSATTLGRSSTEDDLCIRIDIEASERTPLLNDNDHSEEAKELSVKSQSQSQFRRCLEWRAIAFLLLISVALMVAFYLLWRESRLPLMGYTLHLVARDNWSHSLPSPPLIGAVQLLDVLITQTDSAECGDDCLDVLLQLESRSELNYNFLLGGDCQTYEARGWLGLSASEQSPLLVVAFVGSYRSEEPSNCQLEAAQALLLESVKRRRLHPSFLVYVDEKSQAADALQRQLAQWPRYMGLWRGMKRRRWPSS